MFRRFTALALMVFVISQPVLASDVSDIFGIDVNLNKGTVRVGTPNPGHIITTFQKLPQTLAELPGAPLAQAIRWSRERAYPSSQPMPAHIRQQLSPFFSSHILDRARFSVDWGATANGTLPQVILGNGHARAVTLDDVIVFHDWHAANDIVLWAHELTHVAQYSRMSIESFASQYTTAHWTLENEASNYAAAVAQRLTATRSYPQYQQYPQFASRCVLPNGAWVWMTPGVSVPVGAPCTTWAYGQAYAGTAQ